MTMSNSGTDTTPQQGGGDYLTSVPPEYRIAIVGILRSCSASAYSDAQAVARARRLLEVRLGEPWTSHEGRSHLRRALDVLEQHGRAIVRGLREAVWARPDPARDAMLEERPATERQLAFLRSLGAREEPANALEASRLIDDYRRRRREDGDRARGAT